MKLSRLVCSLFVLGVFAGDAFAAAAPSLPNGECYTTAPAGYDYTIYFEHARPTPAESNSTYRKVTPNATSQCVSDLESILSTLRPSNDQECIILIGGADASGDNNGYNNTDLSARRVGLVAKMFTSITNQDCIMAFYGGSAHSTATSPTTYNAEERSVRVIITRKSAAETITLEPITINLTNNITNNTTQNIMTGITSVVLDNRLAVANQKRIDIASIVSDLNNLNNSFGRSHWKTASGNFNGARLASDSIAGVVLGTAGGLITSNIIKKNQLNSGFENLHCVIGGQVVADYKDEFTTRINSQQ